MRTALETPVLLCAFNRPALTARVFERIRQQRPRLLMLACDGPRLDRATDAEKVARTRQVFDRVDWPCEVQTRFLDENLGCKHAMSTAISWAFESTESLIVLEDDCLPDPSFFQYCSTLLGRYRDDPEVMMISGNNFQPHRRTNASYYFSRWAHIWGWATWKRAWQHFDVNVSSWPTLKASEKLKSVMSDQVEYAYWSRTLDSLYRGEIDTWDFPWAYALWSRGGLSVLPETNLVTNIGFGPEATHTTDAESMLAEMQTGAIGTLKHPQRIEANEEADRYTWQKLFLPNIQNSVDAPVAKTARWRQRLRNLGQWLAPKKLYRAA